MENFEAASACLDEALRSLRGHKRLAEGAIAQLREEELFQQLDPEANSVAVLMKHICGNIRSRFTDFLTSDGEKPWRNRDGEFEAASGETRQQLMREWEDAWKLLLDTLQSLKPEDLARTVYIREQPHTVLQALNRQAAHYAYHVGQIVLLAKHIRGAEWKILSVPRGKSEEFNAEFIARQRAKNENPAAT